MTGDGRCPECDGSTQPCVHADGATVGGGADEHGGQPHDPEDPLHIRPYVLLHEANSAQSGTRSEGPPGVRSGTGDAGDVDDAHVPLPDLMPAAAPGGEETAELSAVTEADSRGGKRDGAGPGARSSVAAAPAGHRRMRERRRPSTAVFAGVGVAAVLGGGLLTTQLLTDNGSRAGDGRALRHMPTGAPVDPEPSASPSEEEEPERSERPTPAPSRPSTSATPRADRDSGEHTARPSPSQEEEHASGRPDPSGDRGHRHGRPHPVWPDRPSGETLRPGDSGAEVVELQRRLKQVGYYDRNAREDGVYSARVQEAVFRYQAHHRLWDDTPGEYGPATRRHLEART
ncbi:peptidoglycan-binding protein [Streptomyces sp. A73]|uniref:peptidoglycan-binding domain-containing protein n=1 Tax=Streptomyces sp. RK75 TaxID=2824895 RepID=UPI00162246AA|nr:peptidoglycan-binding domain-containing protein [Streptomyces sp. RK75]MBQ0863310.1 peptidoglycan-binding protein [Streptomyces sp. RK75]MBQ1161214.1 peptidoglycan-binding protein [Streptomyces sp. A73]